MKNFNSRICYLGKCTIIAFFFLVISIIGLNSHKAYASVSDNTKVYYLDMGKSVSGSSQSSTGVGNFEWIDSYDSNKALYGGRSLSFPINSNSTGSYSYRYVKFKLSNGARLDSMTIGGTTYTEFLEFVPPAAPTNLQVQAGDKKATLTWDYNSPSYGARFWYWVNGVQKNYVAYNLRTASVTGLTNDVETTLGVTYILNDFDGHSNLVTVKVIPSATTPTPAPTATPTPIATPEPTPSPTPTPALKPTIDVAIAPEKIGLGKEFTADISLKNVKDIYAEDFEVKYDKEHLQYLGFEEVTGYKVYNKPVDQNGAVRFIVASQGEEYGISKDTVVVKLKFKAKAKGTAVVDATKARIADTEEEYDLEKENCLEDSIIIEAMDVNKSGTYTLVDLAIDARYFKYFAPDVDPVKYNAQQAGDEYVNDDDLLFIVDQILNNPDYLPNT